MIEISKKCSRDCSHLRKGDLASGQGVGDSLYLVLGELEHGEDQGSMVKADLCGRNGSTRLGQAMQEHRTYQQGRDSHQ